VTFQLTPTAKTLAAGTYEADITFMNLNRENNVERRLNLIVSKPPQNIRPQRLAAQIDPPLPVTFGDTYYEVKAAYHTTQVPEPHMWDGKQVGTDLWLKNLGIWFFFDTSGKIETIRFDWPFAGSISGVRIDDPKDKLLKAFGTPTDSFADTNFTFGPSAKVDCDLLTKKVETFYLYQ
jgi:hypothetical protein